MVHAARILIGLRQDDAVAAQLVDGADMLAVAADHFHMFTDLLNRLPLFGAARAPGAEFIVEAVTMLPLIFGIVAVQFLDPLLAPGIIVGVMMLAIVMRRSI